MTRQGVAPINANENRPAAVWRPNVGVDDPSPTRPIETLLCDEAYLDRIIAPIALACGFTDQSHLTRHFKRIVGVTPAAYRRDSGKRFGRASGDKQGMVSDALHGGRER